MHESTLFVFLRTFFVKLYKKKFLAVFHTEKKITICCHLMEFKIGRISVFIRFIFFSFGLRPFQTFCCCCRQICVKGAHFAFAILSRKRFIYDMIYDLLYCPSVRPSILFSRNTTENKSDPDFKSESESLLVAGYGGVSDFNKKKFSKNIWYELKRNTPPRPVPSRPVPSFKSP